MSSIYDVLEEVATALGVLEAAKPYLAKVAAMDAAGASAETIADAIKQMRGTAETAAQAAIDKAE